MGMSICKKILMGGGRIRPLVLCIAVASAGSGAFATSHVVTGPVRMEITQDRRVTGTVIDENGESVIGANILVKGTSEGVITDIEGKFTLTMPSGKNVLEISYVGYKTIEVSTENQRELLIRLEPSSDLLDEVLTN